MRNEPEEQVASERDCIFCKIVEGNAPATKIYEDERVIAIMDIFPWTKGHSLVISKTHAPTIHELPEEDALATMRAAHKLSQAIRKGLDPDGLNLFQSNGRAAWQTVDHFHLHLVPRWFGDPLMPPLVPSAGEKAEIEEASKRILESL